ncbi:phage holin family protein [Niallia sp. HCP3S3_B10]|uniref:phage holin family protein n=1 Tax=Niallia sp. HCP3S3_B10 TaxID=3438944 RepID=UPI003F89F0C6
MNYLQEFGTWIVAGVGSTYAFVTGHTDQAFQILLAMMALDISSGIMKGIQRKKLKSSIMGLGIIKKGAILLSIFFAYLLDILVNAEPVFVTMMTWLAIGNEGLSIIENLTAIGIKIPTIIKDTLQEFIKHAQSHQADKDKIKTEKKDSKL